ncbi:MAG TPA: thiamine phosphate synthase [Candidatus Angelobacter sp.]|nr:thiamine phosphate synthase [Candidatus Angelobacter sp.]
MKLPYSGYLQRPSGPILLYYISDRRQFPGSPDAQKEQLLHKIAECAAAGVDYIQLREKDLSIRALEELATAAVKLLPPEGRAKLLINSRSDVTLACGAHGVHLPANDLPASEARAILGQCGCIHPVIAVSTHSMEELSYAEAHGADLAVFAPVFEKDGRTIGDGLERLQQACGKPGRAVPVLALGGITLENAQPCIAAGANGIAAIRIFQENDAAKIVAQLRQLQFL